MIPINSLICGDCRKYLPKIDSNTIDLVYMDPPFGSTSTDKQFGLKWKNVEEYIEWMKPIIVELHRVLKPTGSLYLHCDYHANAYIRVKILDKIFGYNNFRNEIIWCYSGGGGSKKHFGKKHDMIFFYSKSGKYNFNCNDVRISYTEGGGTWNALQKGQIMKKNIGSTIHNWKPSEKGKVSEDYWLIPFINPMSNERLGYPTQKPEKLLERIIKASSNVGDIVLDPFCGCGTTLSVAAQLGRQFIGIDIYGQAIDVMEERLKMIRNWSKSKYLLEEVTIPSFDWEIVRDVTLTDLKNYDWLAEEESERRSERVLSSEKY
jgi:site-specific DNA-methyltransferase (adenine-specific)